MTRIIHSAALSALAAFYLAVSVAHLDRFPPVHDDEPWIATVSEKLARTGVFGSDVFEGFHNAERHMYMWPPLYIGAVAASYRVLGVNLVSTRLPAVPCGLLVLLLTYAVAMQAGGRSVALLAALLLVALRLAAGWGDTTGIPLLDLARISRYDILVPVFGLLALWTFNRAQLARTGHSPASKRRAYFVCGLLVGLSSLSHLYGAFLLPALLLVLAVRGGPAALRGGAAFALFAGAALPWVPWLIYCAIGWSDFTAQQSAVFAQRYALHDVRFYVSNLLTEVYRYRPLAPRHPTAWWFLGQPATWLAVAGVPAALLIVLLRRAASRVEPVFTLAVALSVQAALFTLLLFAKMYNYMIALWPLAVVLVAWLAVRVWQRSRGRLLRVALLIALAVITVDGGARIVQRQRAARDTTPYREYMQRIAQHVPANARVLGLQKYWLGLHDRVYRSWLLPFWLAHEARAAVSIGDVLARIAPDVVLLDPDMYRYFRRLEDVRDRRHPDLLAVRAYLDQHAARLIAEIDDATYGTMRIYHLEQ